MHEAEQGTELPASLQPLTCSPCPQAPVRSIAFAPGGRFAATAAQGERHIVLWDLGGAKAQKQDGKRPKRAAAGLLSADEPAHALVLGVAETAGDFLVRACAVLCCLGNGEMHRAGEQSRGCTTVWLSGQGWW